MGFCVGSVLNTVLGNIFIKNLDDELENMLIKFDSSVLNRVASTLKNRLRTNLENDLNMLEKWSLNQEEEVQ